MDNKMNRRGFFGRSLLLVGTAVAAAGSTSLFGSLAGAEERRRGGAKPADDNPLAWPWVAPGKDTAAPVNYVEKHADLKKAELKVERTGVKWDDQKCSNCSFYKKVGTKDGKEAGTCQIFPKQVVVAPGWCSTWNKKA